MEVKTGTQSPQTPPPPISQFWSLCVTRENLGMIRVSSLCTMGCIGPAALRRTRWRLS